MILCPGTPTLLLVALAVTSAAPAYPPLTKPVGVGQSRSWGRMLPGICCRSVVMPSNPLLWQVRVMVYWRS